jgi:hypothetical protein
MTPLRRWSLGRRQRARLLDLGAHLWLVDPEGAQLSLHESREPGPVVLVEMLQRLDLLLQRFTLRGQAPDDVLISLLGLMLEFIGVRLGVLSDLRCPCASVGQRFLGVSLKIVGVRLCVPDYLFGRCACVGLRFVGVSLKIVGARLCVPDYMLGLCARVRANLVRLMMSTGDVLLSCSLGQSQHLESLTLGGGIGRGTRLLRGLVERE